MKNEPVVIAQRTFLIDDNDTTSAKIYAPIFSASEEPSSGTWQCFVEIDGILPREILGEGRDSFQALEMAVCALGALFIGLSGSRKLRLPEDTDMPEPADGISAPNRQRIRQPSMISDLLQKCIASRGS